MKAAAAMAFLFGWLSASSAHAQCATPVSDGEAPRIHDCIVVARAAVGTSSCRPCVCDVDGSGDVRITDALQCLRHVVGMDVDLGCPECLSTTTTTTLPPCATCREAWLGLRQPEDLCETAGLLYDDAKRCPQEDCGHQCCQLFYVCADGVTGTIGDCLTCLVDVCGVSIAFCLEN